MLSLALGPRFCFALLMSGSDFPAVPMAFFPRYRLTSASFVHLHVREQFVGSSFIFNDTFGLIMLKLFPTLVTETYITTFAQEVMRNVHPNLLHGFLLGNSGCPSEACALGYKWMRASLASLVCREARGRDAKPCARPAGALGWGVPQLGCWPPRSPQ